MISRCSMLIALLACLITTPAVAQKSLQPNTTWVNQRGSQLTISTINPDGSFVGTYVNRDLKYMCRDVPYGVSGWVYGDEIGFQVRWSRPSGPNCASIASWTGFLAQGVIRTRWELVYQLAPAKFKILPGVDVFK